MPSPPTPTSCSHDLANMTDALRGDPFDLAFDDLLDFSANVVDLLDTLNPPAVLDHPPHYPCTLMDDRACHGLFSNIATNANYATASNANYAANNARISAGDANFSSNYTNLSSTAFNSSISPASLLVPTPTIAIPSTNPMMINSSRNSDYMVNTPSVVSDKLPFSNFHHQSVGIDELCVPCEDMAELEWLSNFVEESFSSCGHHHDDATTTTTTTTSTYHHQNEIAIRFKYDPSFQSTSPISVLEHTTSSNTTTDTSHDARDPTPKDIPESSVAVGRPEAVPSGGRAARSKRRRPNAPIHRIDPSAVCFWNTRILSPEASECILESPNSSSTSTSFDHHVSSYNHGNENGSEGDDDDGDEDGDDGDEDEDEDEDDKMLPKKAFFSSSCQKGKKGKKMDTKRPFQAMCAIAASRAKRSRKLLVDDGNTGSDNVEQAPRKCLHCATQNTPQWRAGPMGPKTLCNACGVRYKSGRLCPEYRPASSPTFIESLHSNSHRKVVEMRRQKGAAPIACVSPTSLHRSWSTPKRSSP